MKRTFLLPLVASLVAAVPTVRGAPPLPSDPGDAKVSAQDGPARGELERPADLWLYTGRTQHIAPPWPVKGVSLTDPEVADVQLPLPDLVVVSGRKPGRTDVVMWSDDGRTFSRSVEVLVDLESVRRDLLTLFPRDDLSATQSGPVLVVQGRLANADEAAQLRAWLDALDTPSVDQTRVAGVQQVQVKVRVAEVSRTATRALGVNGVYAGEDFFGGSMIGPDSGGAINPVSIGPPAGASVGSPPFTFNQAVNVSPGVTLFGGFPDADLEFFIQALAENQYLRLLAEPTLVALSGEEASFLAGGEFPSPSCRAAARPPAASRSRSSTSSSASA